MRRLLVVEDDPIIGKGFQLSLRPEGYDVTLACSLGAARQALCQTEFDVILLDLRLPDGSGIDLCTEIRSGNQRVPILFVAAKGEESVARKALTAGGNDCLCKPFSTMELVGRLRNAVGHRRHLTYRSLAVDTEERRASYEGKDVPLWKRELDLLCLFLRNVEVVISRDQIRAALKGEKGELNDRTVDAHLSRLRAKLRKAGVFSIRIISVYGVGYRLEAA